MATDTLREPPHSLEAEQAVLGGLMLVPKSLAKVSDWLTEDDFFRKDHRLIYRAITRLAAEGTPFDAVTLGDWFENQALSDEIGGAATLIHLANNTASAANVEAYAEIVVEKSRLRKLVDVTTTAASAAFGKGAESRQLIADAMHDLSQIQTSQLRGGLRGTKDLMRGFMRTMDERYRAGAGTIGIETPWPVLTDRLSGFRDGVLYIVGGRPSMGKSVFGCQAAMHAALAGHRTALFSVEMTEEECLSRMIAAHGRMPHRWVDNPGTEDPEAETYWSRTVNSMAALNGAPLLIDGTPALSIEQLMARARREHMRAPLRMIVIDHLHDMLIRDAKQARFEYGHITQGAKTLAKELGIPVILLSQLKRGDGHGKRPTLADLRESGEIEQKADVVLFLHRPDYYNREDRPNVVELIPAKGRNIDAGLPMILRNRYDQMRLDPWTGDLPEPAITHWRGKGIAA